MFNADLVYRGMGGESFSFTMQPPRGDGSINARHFDAVTPLLKSLDATGSFNFVDKDDVSRSFTARYGIVPAHVVLEAVDQFEWANGWDFGPHREALSTAIESGLLEDFCRSAAVSQDPGADRDQGVGTRNFRSSIASVRNASTEQVSPVRQFVSAMRSSTLRAARRRTVDRLRVHFIGRLAVH